MPKAKVNKAGNVVLELSKLEAAAVMALTGRVVYGHIGGIRETTGDIYCALEALFHGADYLVPTPFVGDVRLNETAGQELKEWANQAFTG